MSERLQAFRAYRERMNERILAEATLTTKRFFNLDTRCYEDGALSARTKEMLGLSASLVLRCDDCIAYHVIRCVELGVGREEILEIFLEDFETQCIGGAPVDEARKKVVTPSQEKITESPRVTQSRVS